MERTTSYSGSTSFGPQTRFLVCPCLQSLFSYRTTGRETIRKEFRLTQRKGLHKYKESTVKDSSNAHLDSVRQRKGPKTSRRKVLHNICTRFPVRFGYPLSVTHHVEYVTPDTGPPFLHGPPSVRRTVLPSRPFRIIVPSDSS